MIHSRQQFIAAISALPAKAPLSDRLYMSGYPSHQAHWLAWVGDYDGPGFYGRATSTKDVDARGVYQRLCCGKMIIWLNEVTGAPVPLVRATIKKLETANGRPQTEAKIARESFPWEQLAARLFK